MPFADLGEIELHYKTYGSGPPVLGIMGFALDLRYWAGQVPAVSEGNTFIVFDNRGVGRSSRHPATSIDEMADDAIRLLDHLEIDKAVVLGASMGGAIAQRVVLDHPDRVSGLVLAITFARPIEYTRRLGVLGRMLVDGIGMDAFVDASLMWMFTPQFFEMGREAIDQLVATFMAPGAPEMPAPEAIGAQLDAIEKHDVVADLHRVSCPTLVIGGRRDIMVPGFASEEIAAAIPGAELDMFETGHALMIEEMDRFNSRLRSFLDGLDDSG